MLIRVSDIPIEGVTIEDPAPVAAVLTDPSWQLGRLDLRLERDDADVLVHGPIEATVPLVCSRCLDTFPGRVRTTLDVRLVPRPATGDSVELGADDLDVDFYANDEINLALLVEAETMLALPMKPLCRDECQGLCPVCGGNRNVTACGCQQKGPDPRLAALKNWATRPNP